MKLPKITLQKKPTYVSFAQDIDFHGLFKKIEQEFDTCFIFESLGEEGKFSRYSIIGLAPKHVISARENLLFFDGIAYPVKNPYFALENIMPSYTISKNYAGGLVGYLAYDAINYFESSLSVKVNHDFDQFMFGVYTDGVIFDKVTNELFYFYYDENRIEILKDLLKKPTKKLMLKAKFLGNTSSKAEHEKQVRNVQKHILLGNTFQCEVGFKTKFKIQGDSLLMYERLRKINPSPFMYYLKFNKKRIIGASPELLFSLRDGEMVTRPLAGTIKRGKNLKEDKKLARDLLSDSKEVAEHNMLVDLHRNDIGRVAKFGTVKVRDFMNVKKFSHVQHISSEIVGIMKNGQTMFSALASNFPAGTLTGAPKIESIKIIESLEKEARGVYGGAVGQFGFNGDCTFAIAIRSLFFLGEFGYTQTSGGIVCDSKPEKEYEEIERKLKAIMEVLKKL
ncbi:MAG: anthranilate synthase component I [Candidatus Levybacteria bacterium RIFCSPHIGHO2_12_FULL_38_12]|nr:MAG: anthranilate synthase component I [Candidatus Levybacteria bacterium RIFCSPHIGHO2_01_FULL_38_12]OGH21777.1 MAG: anthranilate synthase component I [Candidatus Levybacteria bacterium RIFCSPHIGHO2_02_FULL_37_18]OGH22565.1 MAG: anthranilate synthase component I [Candidatus Levybacteria bacterium RIFCSPHIGHO2_12_FULL_38_12]OGH33398.1 MAG: anthranilate synthase component I [Candidatus Levybacteria bacterium RIFCSPLOWO2_01_FULL_37_20]OGH44103.1 MAG: anthranilate synthase component I [Candidatu